MEPNLSKRRRLYITTMVSPLFIAIFLQLSKDGLADYFYFDYSFLNILIGFLTLLSLFVVLMFYLQTGFKSNNHQLNGGNNFVTNNEKKLESFETELRGIKEKLKNFEEHNNNNSMELTKEKQSELQELIMSKVLNETTEDIMKKLEEKVEEKLTSSSFLSFINHSFSSILLRLRREISTLNYRSNLNLVLGIMITGVGLYLLFRFVFNGDLEHDNTLSFLVHFAPRISLVIFIEIFAYFFLSLYKTSLSEIKYYQNEMTTIETKYIALMTAYELNSEEITSEVLKELSNNTGYNGEIENIDLQQAKLTADNTIDIFSKILDVYKKS